MEKPSKIPIMFLNLHEVVLQMIYRRYILRYIASGNGNVFHI